MDSLSPECTNLKHRYDSCFNSWFEGYLQPALDADYSKSAIPTTPAVNVAAGTKEAAESTSFRHTNHTNVSVPGPSKLPEHPRIITNWSSAFPSRSPPISLTAISLQQPSRQAAPDDASLHQPEPYTIDTAGKTRTQIKAEEYERNCGAAWRDYQACLQKAINRNENLATLLDQARMEHPLKDQTRLKGTVWDAEHVPEEVS